MREVTEMKATTTGIDLVKIKKVFLVHLVHRVDENCTVKRLFNKQFKRSRIASFLANIPPGLLAWRPTPPHTSGPINGIIQSN